MVLILKKNLFKIYNSATPSFCSFIVSFLCSKKIPKSTIKLIKFLNKLTLGTYLKLFIRNV